MDHHDFALPRASQQLQVNDQKGNERNLAIAAAAPRVHAAGGASLQPSLADESFVVDPLLLLNTDVPIEAIPARPANDEDDKPLGLSLGEIFEPTNESSQHNNSVQPRYFPSLSFLEDDPGLCENQLQKDTRQSAFTQQPSIAQHLKLGSDSLSEQTMASPTSVMQNAHVMAHQAAANARLPNNVTVQQVSLHHQPIAPRITTQQQQERNIQPLHATAAEPTSLQQYAASSPNAFDATKYDPYVFTFMRIISRIPGLVRLTNDQKCILTGFLTSLIQDYAVREEIIKLAGANYDVQKKAAYEFICAHFPFDDTQTFKSLVRGTERKDETILEKIEQSFSRYIVKKQKKHHFSKQSLAMLSKLNESNPDKMLQPQLQPLQVQQHEQIHQPQQPQPLQPQDLTQRQKHLIEYIEKTNESHNAHPCAEEKEWLSNVQNFLAARSAGKTNHILRRWLLQQLHLASTGHLPPARKQLLEACGITF